MKRPKPWRTSKVAEIVRIQNGFSFDSARFGTKVGTPLIRIRDLKVGTKTECLFDGPFDKAYLVRAGDILIGMDGEFRAYKWAGPDALLNQRVCRLQDFSPEVEPDFVLYQLNSHLKEIEDNTPFATVKHLSSRTIAKIEISLPERDDQRRVVGRIKECLNRVEEMQRLRDDAFAETPLVEEQFLAELETALQGCSVPLRELLAETQNGKSLQNKETAHNGRALTLSAVRTHRLDMSATKPVQINVERDDKYLMRPGDVLISRSNTRELVALSAIAPDHIDEPTIFSDLLIRLTPKPTAIRPLYLTIALRMPGARHQLRANAVGSSQTMVKISGERLRTVEVPCPSPAEQERIEAKYTAVTLATSAISEEVVGQTQDLNALRESILREAFAGNL